ncbi:MAG: phosphoribosylamine--glycine ligase [Marinicaulis sp.]|nr:phosphoribosylamine--glycine ligase [Marinicaulis sp.]
MDTSEKRKFLFISNDALHVDCAWRIVREGHDVRYYIDNKAEADIGDGFVPKVETWEPHVEWADIIVFDDVLGHGEIAAGLRAKGKYVIGGTPYTDRLEDDRSFGQDELKNAGIPILNYKEFDDFDAAIAHVEANPRKYVIKPSGEAQNIKRLLFVGMEDDGSDVVRVLEAYKRVWSDTIKIFQLQNRVTGVEVAVGGFFNGKKFLEPININFEHKKLFPGNIGPATGEMGTSMFWSKSNRLFNQTLKKMEPRLAEEGYVGYIDLNCIVNGQGMYPLEFTARFGYPTIQIQSDGLAMPLSDFFNHLASGADADIKVKKGFQVGVRLAVPPYPFRDKQTFESYSKNATIVFKKPMTDGVHIEDVKLVNGEWLVTGSAGVALVVAGHGATMREARRRAYARVDNILIPNMYYRTDIGERWFEDSDKLHSWGYLREN